jgi:hypothetical protein
MRQLLDEQKRAWRVRLENPIENRFCGRLVADSTRTRPHALNTTRVPLSERLLAVGRIARGAGLGANLQHVPLPGCRGLCPTDRTLRCLTAGTTSTAVIRVPMTRRL